MSDSRAQADPNPSSFILLHFHPVCHRMDSDNKASDRGGVEQGHHLKHEFILTDVFSSSVETLIDGQASIDAVG